MVPLGTLVALLNDKEITAWVFGAPLLLLLPFWFVDCFAFRIQRDTRVAMQAHIDRRKERLPSGLAWEYTRRQQSVSAKGSLTSP